MARREGVYTAYNGAVREAVGLLVWLLMTAISVNSAVDTWSAGHLSRDDRPCRDWCSIMSHMCANNSTCEMDHVACKGVCRCSEGWSGPWCKDPVPVRIESMSDKLKDFVEQTPDGINSDEDNLAVPTNADQLFSGSFADHNEPNVPSGSNKPLTKSRSPSARRSQIFSAQIPDAEARKSCQHDCLEGECIKINGDYICKLRINATDSDALRTCGPGFECEHGVCEMKELERQSYTCICESNYVGQFCKKKCPFDCGSHGFCNHDVGDDTYKCFCSWNYTGLNCSEPVPQDEDDIWPGHELTFHWYVVGISVAVVVCLLVTVAMASYFMWKRRLVFILKIVHYFQQCEDDDGKEYDAFISYKSCPRDETFVLQKLYPKLEKEFKFKLCMHFRDFIPGEAIANNIVRAIESSRRTIMVLSPSYVASEWCRMEYQKAQHEMLRLKHKVIPIVLEDISGEKNIDKNLKSILNSVTYLEWPGDDASCSKKSDRFWQKLQLSLPKKSVNSSTNSCSSSSTTSSSPNNTPYSNTDSSSGVTNTVRDSNSQSTDTILSLDLDTSSVSSFHSPSESPASSIEMRKSKRGQNKKKEFKHFMGRLVSNRLFKRQDSSSSQAALVDEETVASRSSCDSISEGFATESSDSACSTPVTKHSYLSDVFCTENTKESMSKICEKDCCECSSCGTCVHFDNDPNMQSTDCSEHKEEFVNKCFEDIDPDRDVDSHDSCVHCKQILLSSDNNRVRISAVDDEILRVQRLPCNVKICPHCQQIPSRFSQFRASSKECKDAANRKILHLRRTGSLPHTSTDPLTDNRAREITLNSRPSHVHQDGVVNDSFCIDLCEDV